MRLTDIQSKQLNSIGAKFYKVKVFEDVQWEDAELAVKHSLLEAGTDLKRRISGDILSSRLLRVDQLRLVVGTGLGTLLVQFDSGEELEEAALLTLKRSTGESKA